MEITYSCGVSPITYSKCTAQSQNPPQPTAKQKWFHSLILICRLRPGLGSPMWAFKNLIYLYTLKQTGGRTSPMLSDASESSCTRVGFNETLWIQKRRSAEMPIFRGGMNQINREGKKFDGSNVWRFTGVETFVSLQAQGKHLIKQCLGVPNWKWNYKLYKLL